MEQPHATLLKRLTVVLLYYVHIIFSATRSQK